MTASKKVGVKTEGDVPCSSTCSSNPVRSSKKPKPISAKLVRFHANRVRSEANSTRGSLSEDKSFSRMMSKTAEPNLAKSQPCGREKTDQSSLPPVVAQRYALVRFSVFVQCVAQCAKHKNWNGRPVEFKKERSEQNFSVRMVSGLRVLNETQQLEHWQLDSMFTKPVQEWLQVLSNCGYKNYLFFEMVFPAESSDQPDIWMLARRVVAFFHPKQKEFANV